MRKHLTIYLFLLVLHSTGFISNVSFSQNVAVASFSKWRVDSLEKLLQNSPDDTNKIIILYKLCHEFWTSKPNKAMNYGKRGLALSKKLKIQHLIAAGLNDIGIVHRFKYNYQKAINYHLQALDNHTRSGRQIAVGWTLIEIGNDYYPQNKYAEGIDYYQKALAVFEKLGHIHGIAVSMNNLGMIHEMLGDYFKAIEYYLNASKKYEELGNKEGIAWGFQLIANIYFHQEHVSNTLKYYIKALKIYEELNDKNWIALSCNNIGSVYNSQGNYSGALKYFFKALNIFEELGIKHKIAVTSSNIGNVYEKKGELIEAMNYQTRAIDIQEKISDKTGIVHSLNGIGNIYNKSGKSPEAVNYLKRSIAIAKELGMKTELVDAYKSLSTAYTLMNNYKRAYDCYQKYANLKDHLYNENTADKIAELQAKYEIEKKEKEIELLTKEKAFQSLELTKNRIVAYASSGAFVLALILGFMLLRGFKKKQRINKILEEKVKLRTKEFEEKNQELEMFMYRVSHDLKGPVASTLGLTNLIKDQTKDTPTLEYLDLISKSVNKLDGILADLNHITIIQQGKLEIESINIDSLINDIIQDFKQDPTSEGIDFRISAKLKKPFKSDIRLLKIIFRNLIENAIKYRKFNVKDSYISINIDINKTDQNRIIEIADNGIGIKKEYQKSIFNLFFRATELSKGSGLGLYLVKNAVEKLKGTISVESSVRKGTAFTLRFPQ